MLERAYEFTGSFENGCELNAVPSSHTTLIRMIRDRTLKAKVKQIAQKHTLQSGFQNLYSSIQ